MQGLWFPPKLPFRLYVAIPSNILSEESSLREKTMKLGIIARALAIFRASRVLIYRRTPDESLLIRDILRYHLTPPYLKKYIPLRPFLRYVGLLPPLRAPSHDVPDKLSEALKIRYREGFVTKVLEERGLVMVDIGLKEKGIMATEHPEAYRRRRFVLVKLRGVTSQGVLLTEVDVDDIPFYWRPFLEERIFTSLYALLNEFKGLKIATSRYGRSIESVFDSLREKLLSSNEVLIVFGAPYEGLYDIAKDEGFSLDEVVDFSINFIPEQGVATVRSEEAMFAVLSILNLMKVMQR